MNAALTRLLIYSTVTKLSLTWWHVNSLPCRYCFQAEGIIWLIVLKVYTLHSAYVALCCSLYKKTNMPSQLFVASMKLTECTFWYDWIDLIILYVSVCNLHETTTVVSGCSSHSDTKYRQDVGGIYSITQTHAHKKTPTCFELPHSQSTEYIYI